MVLCGRGFSGSLMMAFSDAMLMSHFGTNSQVPVKAYPLTGATTDLVRSPTFTKVSR